MISYEENNPPDFSLEEIVGKIKPFDQNVTKNDIKFLYHGSYNVYQLKDEFIIKIPSKILNKMFGTDFILKEIKKLNYLKNKLDIAIPEPIFTSKNTGDRFYIYKKIPGISLSRIFKEISSENLIIIGSQIAEIASNLHSLIEKFPDLLNQLQFDLTYDLYMDSIHKLLENSQNKVFPILNKDEINWINNLFDSFFELTKNSKFNLITTHNDFDTSNILVNPEDDYNVSGIIDFEDFGLGDPTVDLLFQEEGVEFHRAVLNSYSNNISENMFGRIDFHKKKNCLYYLLTGLDQNLPKMVLHGKEMLKERMKGYDY
ncbi:MAG: aminoglycoside phosphotransferase family protein [Candidatus Hodarchaeales archaeon]|jgi:aminoglycoside phosphotransferase